MPDSAPAIDADRGLAAPSVRALPVAARRLVVGVTVSSVGTGLTLPFTFVLLSEVRGVPVRTAGLLLAVPGVVGLLAVPVGGALIDRLGPGAVLRACLLLQGAASALLGTATSAARAVPALALLGLGLGPSFPAGGALLTALVGAGDQARAFGLQFTLLNAGVGVGGLVAAGVVDVRRPATFVALYVANAVTCAAYAALVPAGPPRTAAPPGGVDRPTYREVLRDPVFRRVCLVALLLAVTGYAALDGGLPPYARVVGHVAPATLGLLFAVNTAVIVTGQLLVLRAVRHWRRTRALAAAATVWAASWALLLLVPLVPGAGASALVLVFGGVFGAGETFLAPALQPLVNALATDRLRGRYNALSQSAFSVAFVVSPAVATWFVAAGLGLLWVALLVLAALVAAAVAARLRGSLTDRQDGLPVG